MARAAVAAAAAGDTARATELLSTVEMISSVPLEVTRAMIDQLGGRGEQAEASLRELAAGGAEPRRIEGTLNSIGYALLQGQRTGAAIAVFELNTRLFPEAFNTWDSLGEAYMTAGNSPDAIAAYQKSLELNADNTNATEMLARIRAQGGE